MEADDHYLSVCRYVERNALRANLVARAEDWPWSSRHAWGRPTLQPLSDTGPVPRLADWQVSVGGRGDGCGAIAG